jgi:hypothetical protein
MQKTYIGEHDRVAMRAGTLSMQVKFSGAMASLKTLSDQSPSVQFNLHGAVHHCACHDACGVEHGQSHSEDAMLASDGHL